MPTKPRSGEPDESPPQADELAALLARVDEAVAARQRALADFANYQRRAVDNEARARQDSIASVVRSLVPVLDHFDTALGQDAERVSLERLLGGVRIVRDELAKVLEAQGLKEIPVAVGDELDPHRHEAIARLPDEGVAPNHVSAIFQKGYALGDQVLRPAKVAVAPPDEEA